MAAVLVLAERVGRALRKPTVESMLSYTTGQLGRGWVYALNSALDETGAMIGPLLIALVLFRKGTYQTGYALLLISALLALASVTVARLVFPLPARLESGRTAPAKGLTRTYWLYMVAAACFAAGLMSFELISFHLSSSRTVTGPWIPILLALSTGVGVIASLAFGKLYDRVGLPAVLAAIVLSAGFAPLVFLGSFLTVLAGMLLWGVGYATQDTLFKAPHRERSSRGQAKPRLRAVLRGLRGRLADWQRDHGPPIRSITARPHRLLSRRPDCLVADLHLRGPRGAPLQTSRSPRASVRHWSSARVTARASGVYRPRSLGTNRRCLPARPAFPRPRRSGRKPPCPDMPSPSC